MVENPCSQDLLGWKECRNFQYWMDKEPLTNITAKWFLIITFFPIQIFSYFKLHKHYKNQAYQMV